MARWAIGDLQGCYRTFSGLLEKIDYRHERDELWLAGDLVNRGSGSAACLDWLMRHRVKVVLGNHDLHLIAVMLGFGKTKPSDTLHGILAHPRKGQILEWLLAQPLIISEDHWMSHAGLYPLWSQDQAQALAQQATQAWQANPEAFFSDMYGNEPDRWDESLEGQARWRFIVNALTRMRMISAGGHLDMSFKRGPHEAPQELTPWYATGDRSRPIIFGHWAALEQRQPADQVFALDSGAVWNQCLSALNLDTHQWHHQPTHSRDLIHV